MFPRLPYDYSSGTTRSRSRSTQRTVVSTPGQMDRLPRLSGDHAKRSRTDPKSMDYHRDRRRNHSQKRRVRSLQSQRKDPFKHSRRVNSTNSRKRSIDTTYVLLTPRLITTASTNRRAKSKDSRIKSQTTLSEKESMNEGVVRKSRYVQSVLDQRVIKKKYSFDQTIGEGNFSVVVRCYNRKDGTCWALKAIDKANLDQKSYYIENEADLLYRCIHSNIIKLKEAYQTPDQYFLIMEHLGNGDLFDAIKRAGHFEERTTAKFVWDISNALKYLHDHNIVHRDIKPENLLLTHNYRLKLCDFGLACQVQGPLYRVCGTPTYVAPEVLSEKGYGLEIDCWSLGVIMYILLCGFAPFRHNDRNELFRLIQSGRFQFEGSKWIRISKGAKNLISALLIVEPMKRCSARELLRNAWLKQMAIENREH